MRAPVPLLSAFLIAVLTLAVPPSSQGADDLPLHLRHRVETAEGSGRYHTLTRSESWKPEQSAIVVCDMWDLHHCLNAVRREGEFAPRLNDLLKTAREQGVTIIHAPSDCMDSYADHPARQRAQSVPQAGNIPENIGQWCSKIPAEERGVYPIDQSDGGEDDDPQEHAEWEAKLTAMGRDPGLPWKSQIDVLTIDPERDYITDRGDETWNILESRGIRNVILTGVHTNMCVLGRPFGLRQLAKNGKNVVLVRDLTDTMYNPASWPYVSHFTGTDYIIEHIEKFVCPTITSDQLLGGEPFAFKNDTRPHVVFLVGEDEYRTNETLPKFAAEELGKDYRVSFVHAAEEEPNTFPGIEVVKEADVLFVSVRRRTPPPEQLDFVREHVRAGKPVVGIRTASHAFTLRKDPPPDGLAAWPEFDAQVFGGSYTNHHGNKLVATVNVIKEQADHPILTGVLAEEFTSNGSLYVVTPLAEGTTPLLMGSVEGHDPEPMAWTFARQDGGRSFYTSLGHIDDFQTAAFIQMLKNAVDWAAGEMPRVADHATSVRSSWSPVIVGDGAAVATINGATHGRLRSSNHELSESDEIADKSSEASRWYRCFLHVGESMSRQGFGIQLPQGANYRVWANETELPKASPAIGVRAESLNPGLNRLLVQATNATADDMLRRDGAIVRYTVAQGSNLTMVSIPLRGRWHTRTGDEAEITAPGLPSIFAASPDTIYEVE